MGCDQMHDSHPDEVANRFRNTGTSQSNRWLRRKLQAKCRIQENRNTFRNHLAHHRIA